MNKFTEEFRLKAIELKKQGVHPDKIFTDAGIDISNRQKFYATKLINRWREATLKQRLSSENKKSVDVLKKIRKNSEKKKIEYLEAKVAYLEAENSFLVNLPKKKKKTKNISKV